WAAFSESADVLLLATRSNVSRGTGRRLTERGRRRCPQDCIRRSFASRNSPTGPPPPITRRQRLERSTWNIPSSLRTKARRTPASYNPALLGRHHFRTPR